MVRTGRSNHQFRIFIIFGGGSVQLENEIAEQYQIIMNSLLLYPQVYP